MFVTDQNIQLSWNYWMHSPNVSPWFRWILTDVEKIVIVNAPSTSPEGTRHAVDVLPEPIIRQSLPANPTKAFDGNLSLGNVTLVFGFWAGAVIPLGLEICLFVTAAFYAKPLSNCSS